MGAVGSRETRFDDLREDRGGRTWGTRFNLAWQNVGSNFGDGNRAVDEAVAPDAGAVGATSGGWEEFVAWETVYPKGCWRRGARWRRRAPDQRSRRLWEQQGPPGACRSDGARRGPVPIARVVEVAYDGSGAALGPGVGVP